MIFNRDDASTWPCFRPLIIAHDVGRSQRSFDRCHRRKQSIRAAAARNSASFEELPQGLYGSACASALATIDRRYNSNALIVADLSRDDTYAEVLFEMFGCARDWHSDRSPRRRHGV